LIDNCNAKLLVNNEFYLIIIVYSETKMSVLHIVNPFFNWNTTFPNKFYITLYFVDRVTKERVSKLVLYNAYTESVNMKTLLKFLNNSITVIYMTEYQNIEIKEYDFHGLQQVSNLRDPLLILTRLVGCMIYRYIV
jgi:hypothetical protein